MAAGPVDVRTEVDALREVVLHRPGDELRRLTPRNSADLLFDAVPWVERAQLEHDAFAGLLAARGVEVRYLRDLLIETLTTSEEARTRCVAAVSEVRTAGPRLAAQLRERLPESSAESLADVLVAGMTFAEWSEHTEGANGLPHAVGGSDGFAVPPLPNLLFTRDTAVVLGGWLAVTRPALPVRQREATIVDTVFSFHPDFADVPKLPTHDVDGLEGGDVLVLADGVLAIGVGARTNPAGVEAFAQAAFDVGAARLVLAVPIPQRRATMHLDTICTMVDHDVALMYPPIARELEAWTLTPAGMAGPVPFLRAAAGAIDVDELRVVATDMDPVTAEREQWDDGNNTLAIAPGVVVAYERNQRTNERLADSGIEVLTIAGSELGSGRGGPRCLSCPIRRDPSG